MSWKALVRRRTIPAWATWTLLLAIKVIDWWQREEFLVTKAKAAKLWLGTLVAFLVSGSGQIVLILAGFVAIYWAVKNNPGGPPAIPPPVPVAPPPTGPTTNEPSTARERLARQLAASLPETVLQLTWKPQTRSDEHLLLQIENVTRDVLTGVRVILCELRRWNDSVHDYVVHPGSGNQGSEFTEVVLNVEGPPELYCAVPKPVHFMFLDTAKLMYGGRTVSGYSLPARYVTETGKWRARVRLEWDGRSRDLFFCFQWMDKAKRAEPVAC